MNTSQQRSAGQSRDHRSHAGGEPRPHTLDVPTRSGAVLVRQGESGIEILATPAGLRDLAQWCLALADEQVPDGAHVRLDPGVVALTTAAAPLLIGREDGLAI